MRFIAYRYVLNPSIWSSHSSPLSRQPNWMGKYFLLAYLPNCQMSVLTFKPNITLNHRKEWMSRTTRQISFKSFKKSISSGDTTDTIPELTDGEDLFHEPPKVRFGMLKVTLTIILGLYFGAVCAMSGANFLEEYEIFVKGSDDDDD